MRVAIDVVESAFIAYSAGCTDVPPRTIIVQEQTQGTTLFMPGYLRESGALAIKILSVSRSNSQRNLPLIHAIAVLIDPVTGQVLAVMDAGYLTALRTGAASGVATRYLARPNAHTVAIFGAGVQSRSQLSAVCTLRRIERAFIYDTSYKNTDYFIGEMRERVSAGIQLLPASSSAQAVNEADVICTATTSFAPVFDGKNVKPGTHINAIGSYTPEMQEIDCATLGRASRIVVDTRLGALAEAGDLLVALRQGVIQRSDIYAEIGEIAAGTKKGRLSEHEITYFKSVGNAVQDVAVAQSVYKEAAKQNLGIEITL
jgi:ornithine cyclodeaminase